jgi:hypothetical protein
MNRMGSTGQSLTTISDELLLQLLLRTDLPRYLMDVYGSEADRRIGKQAQQKVTT